MGSDCMAGGFWIVSGLGAGTGGVSVIVTSPAWVAGTAGVSVIVSSPGLGVTSIGFSAGAVRGRPSSMMGENPASAFTRAAGDDDGDGSGGGGGGWPYHQG